MTVVTSFNDCKNARTTKAMLTNRPASGTPPIKDSTERDCILFRLSTNTAPDSRVSLVICHMILDSRDFTLNLNCTTSEADIDFLGQTSRIFGHCRDVLKCCTSLPSSLWASPLRPTQSSKTGLRVRNRKCQILAHPSNVRKFYWFAPENLCLV